MYRDDPAYEPRRRLQRVTGDRKDWKLMDWVCTYYRAEMQVDAVSVKREE